MSLDSVEWWDSATLAAESRLFIQQHGPLIGLTEIELRRRLGEPDRILSGMSEGEPVRFEADHDLHYHSLLGHTGVGFAIANGEVRRMYFMPKVRSCGPDQERVWGKMFATE